MVESENTGNSRNILQTRAIIATLVYFGVVLLIWGFAHSLGKKLGVGIGNEGLNNLGDLLSGLFAPVAFIWLVVAVIIQSKELAAQREELALTRTEMQDSRAVMQKQADAAETQTKLAFASTRANYQLALYDKRLLVFNQLEQIATDLSTAGGVSSELFKKIRLAVESAKYVFGPNVNDWISLVSKKSYSAVRKQRHADRLLQKHRMGGLSEKEVAQQGDLLDEIGKIESELYDDLSLDKIEDLLSPYLQLPMTIDIE